MHRSFYTPAAGFLAVLLSLGGCSSGSLVAEGNGTPTPPPAAITAPTYTYDVVKSYPHDRSAFTQGLVYTNGHLLESTGLNGRSSLREVDLATGTVLKKVDVSSEYFAEGLTEFQDKLYQLTWQSNRGFIYDRATFQKTGDFSYTGEGWGLADDDRSLILSDGTSQIRFLDPVSLKVQRTIRVTFADSLPLDRLNELEYIDGEIYANVWKTDSIARINPQTGRVTSWIDLTGLLPVSEQTSETDILNGIAYDPAGKRLFVTGKLWPKVYEIKLKLRP
ncbi:MAG: glutaminyl-peptide cyclotransferase [Cytophagales bacterium]|nr:glutaminyl-peptide cyclotransferase [Armatimonadota bacterium]